MAIVTGMTAAAMIAIRNGTVVSAHFDSANHLILTKYDGTTVDAGVMVAANTALAGPVELATNAETQSGSATNLAVTPAGLASLPGYRVQIVSGHPETDAPGAWPSGVSLQSVGASSGWSLNNGFGTVITSNISTGYCVQEFYKSAGGTSSVQSWERTYNAFDGGGGWTVWRERSVATTLTPGSFTQTTALSSYPEGWSRLYYTNTGTGWDFSGTYGQVMTYRNGSDYAEQTFTQHSNGTGTPSRWFRTANASGGWTAWQKLIADPGAWTTWTPTWSTSSGIHLPAYGNATANFKAYKFGRKVDVQFDLTFGSTTNFGATPATTDNWTFSLPAAWPAIGTSFGTFLGLGDMYKDASNLGIARIKLASTTAFSFGVLMTFVAGALGGGIGGDVDSVTPWTWASGHAIRGTFSYESAA